MTPERWQQVKAILADAVERDDARQRAAFVRSSCAGDPLLQQEIEALLAYADKPTTNGIAPISERLPDPPQEFIKFR